MSTQRRLRSQGKVCDREDAIASTFATANPSCGGRNAHLISLKASCALPTTHRPVGTRELPRPQRLSVAMRAGPREFPAKSRFTSHRYGRGGGVGRGRGVGVVRGGTVTEGVGDGGGVVVGVAVAVAVAV